MTLNTELDVQAPGPSAVGTRPAIEERTDRSPARLFLGVFAENRLALFGVVLLISLVLFCFVGPILYHTDQSHAQLAVSSLRPGSPGHPLGTDDVGFDVLGRLMQGGQASLKIGIAAALFATIFGALWGALAAVMGGPVDALMMRVVDGIAAIPSLFLLIALARMVTVSVPLLIVVIGLLAWLGPARLVRGESLSIIGKEFVEAVRGMGGRNPRIIVRHLLPNTIGTMAVNATFQVADAILAVAGMGYLGIGVPPPHPDWGTSLAKGITYASVGYWWLIVPAGTAIVLTVIAFNFIGDGLRDAFFVKNRARG
jgi:peptide/nickel transport system permease protein